LFYGAYFVFSAQATKILYPSVKLVPSSLKVVVPTNRQETRAHRRAVTRTRTVLQWHTPIGNKRGIQLSSAQLLLTPHLTAQHVFGLPLPNLTGRGASLQTDSDSTNPLLLPPLNPTPTPSLPFHPNPRANPLPTSPPPRFVHGGHAQGLRRDL
jgi:hypothetical protein